MRLPYVDEHAVVIQASREVVWTALQEYATGLGFGRGNPLALILGTEPRGGFEVSRSVVGKCLVLAGRHHFSRYRLEFKLSPAASGSIRLSARTYAAFPGLHGRVYRALVIGTYGHALITAHMVRSIRRRCAEPSADQRRP